MHSLSYWVEQTWKYLLSKNSFMSDIYLSVLQIPLPLACRSPWRGGSCKLWQSRSGQSGRTRWNSSWCNSPDSLLPANAWIGHCCYYILFKRFKYQQRHWNSMVTFPSLKLLLISLWFSTFQEQMHRQSMNLMFHKYLLLKFNVWHGQFQKISVAS